MERVENERRQRCVGPYSGLASSPFFAIVCLLLVQIDQVLHHNVGDGEIDGPVHEVEAKEGDGEDDAAVLVDVAGLHAEESLGRGRGRRGGRRRGHRRHACNMRSAGWSVGFRSFVLYAGGVRKMGVTDPSRDGFRTRNNVPNLFVL